MAPAARRTRRSATDLRGDRLTRGQAVDHEAEKVADRERRSQKIPVRELQRRHDQTHEPSAISERLERCHREFRGVVHAETACGVLAPLASSVSVHVAFPRHRTAPARAQSTTSQTEIQTHPGTLQLPTRSRRPSIPALGAPAYSRPQPCVGLRVCARIFGAGPWNPLPNASRVNINFSRAPLAQCRNLVSGRPPLDQF